MGEEKGKLQSIREWIVEHKLRTVGNHLSLFSHTHIGIQTYGLRLFFGICFFQGTLWASGIVGSMAYNWSQPNMKTSVKIIHARFEFDLQFL